MGAVAYHTCTATSKITRADRFPRLPTALAATRLPLPGRPVASARWQLRWSSWPVSCGCCASGRRRGWLAHLRPVGTVARSAGRCFWWTQLGPTRRIGCPGGSCCVFQSTIRLLRRPWKWMAPPVRALAIVLDGCLLRIAQSSAPLAGPVISELLGGRNWAAHDSVETPMCELHATLVGGSVTAEVKRPLSPSSVSIGIAALAKEWSVNAAKLSKPTRSPRVSNARAAVPLPPAGSVAAAVYGDGPAKAAFDGLPPAVGTSLVQQ